MRQREAAYESTADQIERTSLPWTGGVAFSYWLSTRRARFNYRFSDLFRSDAAVAMDRRLVEMRGGRLRKLLLSTPMTDLGERLLVNEERTRSELVSRLSAAGWYHESAIALFCTIKIFAMLAPLVLGGAAAAVD